LDSTASPVNDCPCAFFPTAPDWSGPAFRASAKSSSGFMIRRHRFEELKRLVPTIDAIGIPN
jgi:hypothetical protein